MPWFHGGKPGLTAGDLVLPPTETGYDTLRKYGERGTEACARVFVTREPGLAASYAASYPQGDVYQVEPERPLLDDPDTILPDAVKACRRARVVRVTRRAVRRLPGGHLTR
jgi:hypothetical protein